MLSDLIFSESIIGWTAEGKPNTYSQGLVPGGDSNHGNLFLRKDGQWGLPSVWTGSVSETFLSLQDTPQSYNNNLDKYLKVSYEEGGSLVFDQIDTSKVPEASVALYYTEQRVDSRIVNKTQDRSLTNISASGTILANEFVADSDSRLKTNICPLNRCLEQVLNLRPKSYLFKGNSNKHFGLIAQELETIIPELIRNSNNSKALNYIEIIPFLIGSIQELAAEITILKSNVSK